MRKCKIFSILLSIILSVTTLSACGEKENYDNILDKDDPVTITIWHYYNSVQQTSFDEMVKEFNNTVGLEKGIIVEAYTKNDISELANSVISSAKKEPGADETSRYIRNLCRNCFYY